jgi:hypothetical protein
MRCNRQVEMRVQSCPELQYLLCASLPLPEDTGLMWAPTGARLQRLDTSCGQCDGRGTLCLALTFARAQASSID